VHRVIPSFQTILGGLALALVALFAYQLRTARAPASHNDGPSSANSPEWLIDDPDAAYHLRRVELALANGRVPSSDVFLNHPSGSPVPWPPFFDGALAVYAQLRLGEPPPDLVGGNFIDDRYERQLEQLLVYLPPWLGVWTTLAVGLAAGALVSRSRSGSVAWVAAVLAAMVYACAPLAVWYGDIARIDHHVAIALLFALHMAVLGWVLSGPEEPHGVDSNHSNHAVDATWGGLLAGSLAGLALLTWLASAVLVALAGLALFFATLSSDPKRRKSSSRAGFLYFLAAAAVTLFPALGSAWNEAQPGSLINLTTGVPVALLAASLAFLAPSLFGRVGAKNSELPRFAGGAISIAAALLAVFLLPGFLDGVREGAAWASRNNLFMDVVDESRPLVEVGGGSVVRGVILDIGWIGLLIPGFLVAFAWIGLCHFRKLGGARAPGLPAPAAFYLAVNLLTFAAMALSQRRFGNSLAVPLAICTGVLCGLALSSTYKRVRILGAALLLAVFGSTAVQGQGQLGYEGMAETQAWRAELLDGLRWMREGTLAPGDWRDPETRQSYGVLSAWHAGHLIEYHARRPILATNFGSFVGPEHFADSGRLLLGEDPAAFLKALEVRELDYVVVTARQASDIASMARVAGLNASRRSRWFEKVNGRKGFSPAVKDTMLWRLALDEANEPIPGMELVWVSSKTESIFGGNKPGPRGPIVSIWRRSASTE